ncbi:MAG: hypothetical protein ACLQUZ_10355 [Rhizomicrobium sp.]
MAQPSNRQDRLAAALRENLKRRKKRRPAAVAKASLSGTPETDAAAPAAAGDSDERSRLNPAPKRT